MAGIRRLCLRAFRDGHKEEALRLLAQIQQPDQQLVHRAAYQGWLDLCQQLVENYKLSPSAKAEIFGDVYRPLHLACEYGRVEVVRYLLTLPSVLLTVNERDGGDGGLSALDLACKYEHLSVLELLLSEPSVHLPRDYLHTKNFAVLSFLSKKLLWSTQFFVMSYFHVFMAGNTASGKTTLTKAMVKKAEYSFSRFIPGNIESEMISKVKTLTAGICPSQCSG